jgi:arginine decarboxylase
VPDRAPLAPAAASRRPYFETLFVTAAPAANFPQIAQELRRLRRAEDPMIYEPVLASAASRTAIMGCPS